MASTIIATALCPEFGYERAMTIAKRAGRVRRTVVDAASEELSILREAVEQIVDEALEARR